MVRPILTLPPKAKTLAQQNADFTAEGAPPPGKVGMSNPDTGHDCVEAVSHAPTIVVSAHKRRPSGKKRLTRIDDPERGLHYEDVQFGIRPSRSPRQHT